MPFTYYERTTIAQLFLSVSIASNKYYYGYYVWSDNKIVKPKLIAKYIGRYVRHPAIANGRIAKFDKHNVTFFYLDNERNRINVKKPITSFIASLIQHIPPEQFKMIRYYGAYSRNLRRKYTSFSK